MSLEEQPFSYRTGKGGKVFLFWRGRQVLKLQGGEAEKFLKRVESSSTSEAQLVMARITGNFKR